MKRKQVLEKFGLSAEKLNKLIELGIVQAIDPETNRFFKASEIVSARKEYPVHFAVKKIADLTLTDTPFAELLKVSRSMISYLVMTGLIRPIDFRRGHFVFTFDDCNSIIKLREESPHTWEKVTRRFIPGKAYPRLTIWNQIKGRKSQHQETFSFSEWSRKTASTEWTNEKKAAEKINLFNRKPKQDSRNVEIDLKNATMQGYRYHAAADCLTLTISGSITVTINGFGAMMSGTNGGKRE